MTSRSQQGIKRTSRNTHLLLTACRNLAREWPKAPSNSAASRCNHTRAWRPFKDKLLSFCAPRAGSACAFNVDAACSDSISDVAASSDVVTTGQWELNKFNKKRKLRPECLGCFITVKVALDRLLVSTNSPTLCTALLHND
jgi:hypothetical protein